MSQTFDYQKDVGPEDGDHLKCSTCGSTGPYNHNKPYEEQGYCPVSGCGGHMMGWNWEGWKSTRRRRAYWKEQERAQKEGAANPKPVSQESELLSNFDEKERTIPNRDEPIVISAFGMEAPWLSAYGACFVKVFGIRRHEGKVQFGIGNEQPPILGWVEAGDFYNEWPD